MDVASRLEIVRELCSFENRLAGTDAERRAANRLAERLRGLGRKAEVEPTYVHPQYGLIAAAHCAVGFAGSLVAVEVPVLGFALVLAAATSMYLDLNYRLYLLRRLFFRRASQNVVSRGRRPDAPARLIVCAHLDTTRTGAIHSPWASRLASRIGARMPSLGPFRALFWSLAVLLPLLGARMAGLESDAIAILQLVPTLILLVGIFAGVELELSPVAAGANDNASGVATAISLAAELDAEPPDNLDVWVLLTGGSAPQQEGMRAFVRSHRAELDRERTYLLDLDSLGHGDVRYETAAGWVVSYAMDERLIELAAALAEAEPRFRAGSLRHGVAGDSLPARLAGVRSLGLTCRPQDGPIPHRHSRTDLPDTLDPEALERAHGFALELVRVLDRDVSRSIRKPDVEAVAA